MSSNAVVLGATQNRRGVIAQISQFLKAHGANIESTFASNMEGIFCCNILFSAPDEDIDRIIVDAGKQRGIRDIVKSVIRIGAESEAATQTKELYELSLYAFDAKGIVSKVTQLLRANGIDIHSLSGGACDSAPMSGGALFAIEMKIEVPSAAIDTIAIELEKLARKHTWDIDLRREARDILIGGQSRGPIAADPQADEAVRFLRDLHDAKRDLEAPGRGAA